MNVQVDIRLSLALEIMQDSIKKSNDAWSYWHKVSKDDQLSQKKRDEAAATARDYLIRSTVVEEVKRNIMEAIGDELTSKIPKVR